MNTAYLREIKRLTPLERMVYYMTERFEIWKRREKGLPREVWTTDPILATYKFTNVRRALDYTSQWLTQNWYAPHGHETYAGILAAFARFFCYVPTFEIVGLPRMGRVATWLERGRILLKEEQQRGKKVFTSAYIIGGVKPGQSKVDWVIRQYLTPVHESTLLRKPWTAPIIELHDALRQFNGWGDFMTQEVVLDLQQTFVLQDQTQDAKMMYAMAGPGAMRGLCRVNGMNSMSMDDVGRMNRDDARQKMVELWADLRLPRNGLPLELRKVLTVHDVEFCLCEFDKYERTLWGQGTPKQLFSPRSDSELKLL